MTACNKEIDAKDRVEIAMFILLQDGNIEGLREGGKERSERRKGVKGEGIRSGGGRSVENNRE